MTFTLNLPKSFTGTFNILACLTRKEIYFVVINRKVSQQLKSSYLNTTCHKPFRTKPNIENA